MPKRRRGIPASDLAALRRRREGRHASDETLYGLYEGVPRTEWGADEVPFPNAITIFRLPLEEDFPDPLDLEDEVRITVAHELAHHMGIDDERLAELGVEGAAEPRDGRGRDGPGALPRRPDR